MQYSIVNYKTVKGNSDFRIDAEYYHPVYLTIHEKIKLKSGVLFFSKIKKISSGKNLSQVDNGKYKFIRTQNIRPILIDEFGISNINDLNNLKPLKEGELLFVRVGEGVGNSSIVTKNYSGNAISDNVLRLEINKINPYFCSVFFNSLIGQTYFRRVFKGTARSLISQENFKDIFIPVFSDKLQKFIQNLVELSLEFIEKSKNFYSQAEQLLLSELGLLNWKPKQELAFVKKFSNTQKVERFDAEYFQPKYDEIMEALKRYEGGFDGLGNLTKIKKSIEPGSEAYQESGIMFVRVSNLSKFELSNNNQQFISEKLYDELKKYQPKKGEILLSKDATPGIAYYLNEEPEQMIVSGGILRLKIESHQILPEYLTLVLNSIVVQKQIDRDVGGSVINHWRPDQIKMTIIPILDNAKQKEIKELIEKSFFNREQSKSLLEIAKRGVEIAIEKNEEEAEKWIYYELDKIGGNL